jgi:hypothetical protein
MWNWQSHDRIECNIFGDVGAIAVEKRGKRRDDQGFAAAASTGACAGSLMTISPGRD